MWRAKRGGLVKVKDWKVEVPSAMENWKAVDQAEKVLAGGGNRFFLDFGQHGVYRIGHN